MKALGCIVLTTEWCRPVLMDVFRHPPIDSWLFNQRQTVRTTNCVFQFSEILISSPPYHNIALNTKE